MGTSIEWDPDGKKPAGAAALEARIAEVAPGARVKLTWREGAWRVRALAPAAMCVRGAGPLGRDQTDRVVEVLEDAGLAAAVWKR